MAQNRGKDDALLDRSRGALLGLALGDILGAPVEFKARDSFPPVTDLRGGGPFDLEPGQFTDDTALALCLADSLIQRRAFDLHDQIERYCRWWRDGENSVTGYCFDIGHATRSALMKFQSTGDPLAGSKDANSAGNGSIMRLAPVPIHYADDARKAVHYSGESSLSTHGAEECVSACRYLGGLIHGALNGMDKSNLLARVHEPFPGCWSDEPLAPAIEAISLGSFHEKERDDIRSSGYVVDTLEAALWALWNHDDFESGALAVVNLGDDADTVGAVYGQIAGALYGHSGLPRKWLDKLSWRSHIEELAADLTPSV